MAMTQDEVVALVADELMGCWQQERKKLDKIDRWARWDHESPHKPRHATAEYKELSARAQAPWGALIVTSIAQTLYVEGYRRPEDPEDSAAWGRWQANQFDARQVALHRSALSYGLAYATSLPGISPLTKERMPVMRGVSPREMLALYADPADDEWPYVALKVRKTRANKYKLTVLDDEKIHHLTLGDIGDRPDYDSEEIHDSGVCPVVRYANRMDLEGRSAGEVEPFIPLLGRIDQTVFDRLVVQRFASWIVRTIAGMDLSKTATANGVTVSEAIQALKVNDFLTSENADTKFGSIPATPLDGFIKGEERDLTDLSAASQTPAFELLGGMTNLSADALAAAKGSQDAKSEETKHIFGESHEQLLRLGSHQAGDTEAASDFRAQVRWADTSIRSLAQAVDALGKMATMLGFPPELLWAKVPGITQQDVDEAKVKITEGGGMDALLAQLTNGQVSPELPVA